jgi:hypothetical protein
MSMQHDISIEKLIQEAEVFIPEPPISLLSKTLDFQQYPIDALGEALRNAAKAINEKIQAPMSICAQSVLAAASLSVQHIADIELPTDQTRPISNFFLSVGDSGERKSSVDNEALKGVKKFERENAEKFKQQCKDWKVKHKLWENAAKKLQGTEVNFALLEAHLKAEPKKPLRAILIVDDSTIEGLVKCFSEGRSSLGLFTSEGGQFLGGYSLKENLLNTCAILSKFWDGSPQKSLRASRGEMILDDCRLSTHLMIQPKMAREFLSNPQLRDQGILTRFLCVHPPSATGTRFFKEVSDASKTSLDVYHTRIQRLLESSINLDNQREKQEKRILKLTQKAKIIWISFSNEIEQLIAPDNELEPVKGLANKLAEHAARLAGIIALFENPDCTDIDDSIMDKGIRLAQFYAYELLRITEAYQVPEVIMNAEKIRQWLQEGWKEEFVSIPDIQQLGPNSFRNHNHKIREALQVLEAHNWLIKLFEGKTIQGKKRAEVWRIVRSTDENPS